MTDLNSLRTELHIRVETAVDRARQTLENLLKATQLQESHRTSADLLAMQVYSDSFCVHMRTLLDVCDAVRENRVLYNVRPTSAALDLTREVLADDTQQSLQTARSMQTDLAGMLAAVEATNTRV